MNPRSLLKKVGEPRYGHHGPRSKAERRRHGRSHAKEPQRRGHRAKAWSGRAARNPKGARGLRVQASSFLLPVALLRLVVTPTLNTRKTLARGRTHFLQQASSPSLLPFCLALLAGLVTSPHGVAQERQGGPLVLQLPASAAALSLGTAFPLSRPFSEVVFYNPSLLTRVNGFGVGIERFGSESTHLNMSAGTDWAGGAIGIGVQTLSYSTAAETIAEIPHGVSDLLEGGDRGVSEIVVSGAYARSLFGVRWGVTGKLIEQRFDGSRGSTVAADLGASKDIGPVTVGLAAQNLGEALELDGTELALADRVTLGAALHGRQIGELDLGATVALSREADGEYLPAGGLELAWWPVVGRTFIARVGVRRVVDSPARSFTFGGSFIGDAITVEYAYQGHDGLDASHRFGVSWR